MVLPQHFCTWWWWWQKAQQSLTPIVDWLDCLIGPDGLLFVVPPHLLVGIPVFQFYMLEVGEKKVPTYHVILVLLWGHIHTKHGWRCFWIKF
jgi:hypothetical protein